MASKEKEFKITAGQLIFPVSLTAFVVFIMLAFQTSQLMQERDVLTNARAQQEKPLQDLQKVKTQLDAVATGTKKLADEGNTSAQTIVENLKKAGITIGSQQAAAPEAPAAAPTAAPKADAKAEKPKAAKKSKADSDE